MTSFPVAAALPSGIQRLAASRGAFLSIFDLAARRGVEPVRAYQKKGGWHFGASLGYRIRWITVM
jgi:hypothetical protein